jgi:hypothetical protein
MNAPIMIPGDILLHHNKGFISDLIRRFDGSQYSHASLVYNATTVAEANAHGVRVDPLGPAIAAGKYTDTYRLRREPPNCDPVLARARYYLGMGERYAFEELVFLALLCTVRRIPLPRVVRVLLRKVLDAAASLLNGILAAGRQPMICSEFVYRCYDEALPEPHDAYSIDVGSYSPEPVRTAVPEGAPHAPARRGLGADTLLAAVLRRDRVAGFAKRPPVVLEPLRAVPAEELAQGLAEDAEAYLRVAAPEPGPDWITVNDLAADDELVARLERFVTLAAGPRGATQQKLTAVGLAERYETFTRSIADFVTPADLAGSPSLDRKGRTMGTP